MLLKLFYILWLLSRYIHCQNVEDHKSVTNDKYCPSVLNYHVASGGAHCCNSTYNSFLRNYKNFNLKLTSLLEKLRAWNCPQFAVECQRRYFEFNRFTSLVYDRFCNETAFIRSCRQELRDIHAVYNVSGGDIPKKTLYSELIFSSPCLQANAYEYGKFYGEIARPLFGFCNSVWCGFNENALTYHKPSLWLCIPNSCRASIVIVIVVCCVLAVSVTIANITVIVVILRNPRYPTSQMIYKLSLALADLFVGLFVFPSSAISIYRFQIASFERRTVQVDFDLSNHVLNSTVSYVQHEEFDPAANDYYRPSNHPAYNSAFGFITAVSIFASVSTLMFASYDRFRAIHTPLLYNQTKAATNAHRITFALWIFAIAIGLLPIVVDEISAYRILAGGALIALSGESGLILYGIALGIPLVSVWIFTVSVSVIIKRQAKRRKKLMSKKQVQDSTREQKLTRTLHIMVGVFTACVLPSFIFVMIPEIIPSFDAANVANLAKKPASVFISLELASVIIISSNSLWNCFIYSFRNKDFRRDAASLYLTIMSVLGIVRVREAIKDCLCATPHQTRRKISSAIFTTNTSEDLSKDGASSPEQTFSLTFTAGTSQPSSAKTEGPTASSISTFELDSNV